MKDKGNKKKGGSSHKTGLGFFPPFSFVQTCAFGFNQSTNNIAPWQLRNTKIVTGMKSTSKLKGAKEKKTHLLMI